MKTLLSIILVPMILLACSNDRCIPKYTTEGYQILDSGDKCNVEMNFQVSGNENLLLDSQAYIKVFPDQSHHRGLFKITNAYFKCPASASYLVDTTKGGLLHCKNQFILEDDTIKIYFRPSQRGTQNFQEELSILTVDDKNIYHLHKKSFTYIVR